MLLHGFPERREHSIRFAALVLELVWLTQHPPGKSLDVDLTAQTGVQTVFQSHPRGLIGTAEIQRRGTRLPDEVLQYFHRFAASNQKPATLSLNLLRQRIETVVQPPPAGPHPAARARVRCHPSRRPAGPGPRAPRLSTQDGHRA